MHPHREAHKKLPHADRGEGRRSARMAGPVDPGVAVLGDVEDIGVPLGCDGRQQLSLAIECGDADGRAPDCG